MNLIAAAAIVGTIYIFINWFIIPHKPKKKGKVIPFDDDDTTRFYNN